MFEKYANFFWKLMLYGWVVFPASSYLLPNVQAWKNIFYAVILLPFLVLLPCIWRKLIRLDNPIFIVSFLMAVYLWITTFWSYTSPEYIVFFFKQLVYVFVYLSVGFLLVEKYPHAIDWAIKLIVAFGFISLTLAIFYYTQTVTGNGLTAEGWLYRFEGVGMIKNPIVAAQHYGLLSLVAIYCFTTNKQILIRVVLIVIALLAIFSVYWTRSRGPSLYLPISLLLLVFLSEDKLRKKFLTVFFIVLSVLTLLLLVFPTWRQALFSRDFSISRRMDIWTSLIDEASTSFLFGVGARKIMDVESLGVTYHHAHSSFVEMFYYGGVVALFLLFVCIFTVYWKSFKLKENALLIPWFSYGLLCLATNGYYLLSRPGWQWLMFWIPIAFIIVCHHRNSMNNNPEQTET